MELCNEQYLLFQLHLSPHKKMLMMPEAVRAVALLIHKIFVMLHMSNFSHPVQRNFENRLYSVFYNLSRVHFITIML